MEQEMREGLDSETRTDLLDFARGRRLLFITTKNIDYIRNSQEIDILSSSAESVRLIYSGTNCRDLLEDISLPYG